MATRLDELLDTLTPSLDRALRGEGLPLPTATGVIRIRQAKAPARPPEAKPEPRAAPAPRPEAAPRPEPRSPSLQRDRAEEIVVGFSPRRIRPPAPPPPAPPAPEAAPAAPPREHLRTISVSRDEPTRKEKRTREEVARRVPLDRVIEVLAMAPGGAASASELAAWFGVAAPSLETLMKSWCKEGLLVTGEGDSYLAAPVGEGDE